MELDLVSECLGEGFSQNPFYNKLSSIVTPEDQALLASIAAYGGDLGIFGQDIPSQLVDQLVGLFDAQLDDVINRFERTEPNRPNMPPAPHSVVLYGRFGTKSCVLDIGSGDGKKAERAKIRDLVLSDKVKSIKDRSRKFLTLDFTDADQLEFGVSFKTSRVLASFMVLTQVEDISSVRNKDGLHVIPNVDQLVRMGAVHDGKGVRVRGYNRDYFDYDHNDLGGQHLSFGYLGVAFFEPGKFFITILKDSKIKTTPIAPPQVADGRFSIDPRRTPKYDGIQLVFDLTMPDGRGLVYNRRGQGYRVLHNMPNCQFVAEHSEYGVVLLRLLNYRGYVPWHNLSTLEEFCSQKNIDIGGDRLYPPGHVALRRFPVDGWIDRRDEIDFRIKFEATVDIDAAMWKRYVDKMTSRSIPFTIDVPPERLGEYSCECVDGVYGFKFIRHRFDKISPTSFDVWRYYMGNVV